MMQTASIGHNSKLTKQELEQAFRAKTREQRIRDNTPFDIRWQWEIWLSDLSSSAMLVAFAIRIYADKNGSESSPSIEALQHLTKQSRNTVLAAIREIGKLDFIRKEIGKGRARNTYQLTIPSGTIGELANIFDIRSGAAIEPQSERYGSTSEPQSERSGSVTEPQAMVQPVNHKAVVVQSDDRSGSTIEPNITKNITTVVSGSLSKVAAALAAGMATSIAPVATAAHPHDPPAVHQPSQNSIHDLADRLFAAAGNVMNRTNPMIEVMTLPRKWIEEGCDLEKDILPTIRAMASRKPDQSVSTWKFFERAVAEAKAAREAPMAQGDPPQPDGKRKSTIQGNYSFSGEYIGRRL